MSKAWSVVIIGSGSAGLFASIAAAREGARVLLLERGKEPGGKLPFSGGGRGNLTHAGEISELLRHYHSRERPEAAARFLRPALYSFSNADLMDFFKQRGLPLVVEADGRAFPRTNRAKDALSVLLREIEKLGVEVCTESRVMRVTKTSTLFSLVVVGRKKRVLKGASVIVATGGLAHPQLGATGDGYRLAVQLGHRLVPCRPALVPVIVEDGAFAPFANCAGLAVRNTVVFLERRGRIIAKKQGDVLFTHRGLSGPAVLDISREVEPEDVLRVILAPKLGKADSLEKVFIERVPKKAKQTISSFLHGFGVPKSLAIALAEARGISPKNLAGELTRTHRRYLVESLAKGHPFPVKGVAGWEEAMVTSGGVALGEVNPKTMESRVVPRLFFAGEILDFDGESGGYNLQAAFSTGFLAGRSAAWDAMQRS